ncbi:MAG: lysophospholipid acyltransferase family protein [bacterium]|nr:lysophospholipid acyltransferase family protein [bacterium]
MAFDLRTLLSPLFRWRATSAEGLENLPKSGAAILVANHVGLQDPQALIGVVLAHSHRMPYILAKWKIFANPLVRYIANTIPLYDDRSQTIAEVTALLQRGELVCFYPEAGVNTQQTIGKVKTGAARLALASRAPVIPIGLRRTSPVPQSSADHRHDILFGRVQIIIGKPIDLSTWYGLTVDRPLLDKVTGVIMTRVAELAGKTYTG